MNNILDRTIKVCKSGTGVGGNGYRLAASVFCDGRVYSSAVNTTKTHPLMLRFSEYPHLHAEVHACIKAGLDNCKGKDIVVVRLKKNGNLGLAKPCPSCRKFLKHVGVRNVYYTNDKGDIECELSSI